MILLSVTPTWIDGAGHNDVPLFPIFWLRLKRFIEIDLRRESPSVGSLRIISKTSSEVTKALIRQGSMNGPFSTSMCRNPNVSVKQHEINPLHFSPRSLFASLTDSSRSNNETHENQKEYSQSKCHSLSYCFPVLSKTSINETQSSVIQFISPLALLEFTWWRNPPRGNPQGLRVRSSRESSI